MYFCYKRRAIRAPSLQRQQVFMCKKLLGKNEVAMPYRYNQELLTLGITIAFAYSCFMQVLDVRYI